MDPGSHMDSYLCVERMTDEEVVMFAKTGSRVATEHLLNKYRSLVEGKARSYYLVGADHEDVVQEGMIGLYKAIRDFRTDRLAKFKPFAELCVTRQIITAVKTATRQKHMPLNNYVPLHKRSDGDAEFSLVEVLPDSCVVDPERVVTQERIADYLSSTDDGQLSTLESSVLHCYLQGLSYKETAALLQCQPKSVDNALQRAKRKIGWRIARGWRTSSIEV